VAGRGVSLRFRRYGSRTADVPALAAAVCPGWIAAYPAGLPTGPAGLPTGPAGLHGDRIYMITNDL
jgi:hypothetical protein